MNNYNINMGYSDAYGGRGGKQRPEFRNAVEYTPWEKFVGFFRFDSTGVLWAILIFFIYLITVLILYWICFAIFVHNNIKWFADGTIIIIVDMFLFLSLLVRFWGDVEFFKCGLDQFAKTVEASVSMGDYLIKSLNFNKSMSASRSTNSKLIAGIVNTCNLLAVARARGEVIDVNAIGHEGLRAKVSNCISETSVLDPLECNNTVEAAIALLYEELMTDLKADGVAGMPLLMRQAIDGYRKEANRLSVLRWSKGPFSIWFISYCLLYVSMLLHYIVFNEELQIGGAIWSLVIYAAVASALITVMSKSRNFWEKKSENVYAFAGAHDIETIAFTASRLFEQFSVYTLNTNSVLSLVRG